MKMQSSAALSAVLLAMTASAAEPVRMPISPVHPAPITCSADAGWDEPMPPRRIFGDAWYVGTCGISSVLIASPRGHILIDAGARKGASLIEANLKTLGVALKDIRYIVVSHEHYDHVGGLAELQRDTGATVLTRLPAVASLQRGKSDRRDPQFDSIESFPPVANVKAIQAGGTLKLGTLSLRNLPMPGHTVGGSGWTWQECEGTQCLKIVYSESTSAISDKHYHYAKQGSLQRPLRNSLSLLAKTRCDVLLTTHPSSSNLVERLDGKAPLVAPDACKELSKSALDALEKRLRDEAAGKAP